MKYYFESSDSELCYTKDHFIELIRENEIKEMTVYPAKIEYGTGYFFCVQFNEISDLGECGTLCEEYKPRNGKNGRCRFHSNCYVPEDKPVKLKIK
jgi:hypothetical protein